MTIRYLNTDLDLISPIDLTALASVLAAKGAPPLYVTHGEDDFWYATFETDAQHKEPDTNIPALLDAVEALGEAERHAWSACTRRELNIGYDCGAEPWAFNQGITNETLGRMARAGMSLRITLYPPRPETSD